MKGRKRGSPKLAADQDAVCGVCGRQGRLCRFEIACTCWYGIPCSGGGTVAATRRDLKREGLSR